MGIWNKRYGEQYNAVRNKLRNALWNALRDTIYLASSQVRVSCGINSAHILSSKDNPSNASPSTIVLKPIENEHYFLQIPANIVLIFGEFGEKYIFVTLPLSSEKISTIYLGTIPKYIPRR